MAPNAKQNCMHILMSSQDLVCFLFERESPIIPHEQFPSLKWWKQFMPLVIIFHLETFKMNMIELWQSSQTRRFLLTKVYVPGYVFRSQKLISTFSLCSLSSFSTSWNIEDMLGRNPGWFIWSTILSKNV